VREHIEQHSPITMAPVIDGTDHVRGTPTLFIDGVLHRGAYDAPSLLEALSA
jgi:glutaredoxin